MIRTFVDASVLIASARGVGNEAMAAEAILQGSNRLFLTSEFVRLEVLPKPLYFKNADEIAYYQTYFTSVQVWAPPTAVLVQRAFQLASMHGLSAVDALHVAAAEAVKADEFVTGERTTTPLFRVTTVRVVSIRA